MQQEILTNNLSADKNTHAHFPISNGMYGSGIGRSIGFLRQ